MNIAILATAILGLLSCFAFYQLGFDAGREHQHQLDMCELRNKIACAALQPKEGV